MKRLYRAMLAMFASKSKTRFVPNVPMLVGCRECEKLVTKLTWNRLTVHLVHHHGLADDEAYSTVDWVAQKVREQRRLDKVASS
jgi:hypothetical protein